VLQKPPAQLAQRRGQGKLSIEPDFYYDYVRLFMRVPRAPRIPPTLRAWHGGEIFATLTPWSIAPNVYVAGLPLNKAFQKPVAIEGIAVAAGMDTMWGAAAVQLFPVSPERGGVVRSNDGLSELGFEGGAVYRMLYARIEELTTAPSSLAPVVGKAYRFEPADVPLKGKGYLTIYFPEPEQRLEQLAIYSIGRGGALRYVGKQVDPEGHWVRSPVTALGTFAVVRDSVPPLIVSLRPGEGEIVATDRPTLRVEFYDKLSGIGGEEAIELLLNGQRVISEYDPPRRCAFYSPRKPLTKGRHRVTARIRDRCGNTSMAEHTFFIR
jgi:hypothetical protein